MRKLSKLWLGLTAVLASLLCVAIVGTSVAYDYAGVINDALDIQTSKIVKGEADDNADTIYYKSSFGDFNEENLKKLEAATREQNIAEMREGAALLKNDKNVLPLKTEKKISVFGFSAVQPAYQGSAAGNKVTNNTAEKTDLKAALTKEGFEVNETILNAYTLPAKVNGTIGGHPKAGTGVGEESPAFYDARLTEVGDYTDAAIVVLSRVGAEGKDMEDDEFDDDGITRLSSLALHSNEREMLKKVRNRFEKVVVLLNVGNPMEVEEVKTYCDAMLYMGLPGNYGFEGVAEILRGKVNPSGHLADTYAVNSLSAPANVNSGTSTPEFTNAAQISEQIDEGGSENASWISFQAESIYIGYRYYETRYADAVAGVGNASDAVGAITGATSWKYADEISYPFGYGLSYTKFTQKIDSVNVGSDEIEMKVTVTNSGSVAGKSVVQVYAQTPYGKYEKDNKVEKSAISLVGFAKTKELAAGASEQVTVTVDKYLLASYDYVNEKGYILSGGDYYLAIGENAHDALNNVLAAQGRTGMTDENGASVTGDKDKAYKFSQTHDANKYRMSTNDVRVTNQFDDCDLNYFIKDSGKYLSRNDWKATFPTSQTTVAANDDMIKLLSGETYETPKDAPTYASVEAQFGKDSGLTLVMMRDVPYEDKITWRKFVLQIKIEDLPYGTAEGFTCPAVGTLSPSFKVGDGCDSNMGSITIYEKSGTTRPNTDADGKVDDTAKVKRTNLRYCSKPTLTGTFNTELYAGRGKMMGEESLWSNLMENYNVGADVHRTPFGGRAFEYMSECPNLAYLAAIPEVQAMEKTGSHAAPKHFAGNDQETHREGVACFFTEQGFREGALRAFEGALKVGKAGGLMQSFERLGCTWASASYAMNTQVLRNEWGWKGNIVTDAAGARNATNFNGYKNHAKEVFAAGTEQFCLDSNAGHAKEVLAWAKENNDGYLVECMINATISWEYAIANSVLVNGMSSADKIVQITPWWKNALIAVIVSLSVLTAAALALGVVSKVMKEKEV